MLYYVAILLRTRLKPRIPRVRAKYLNTIDDEMRRAGVITYDLGVVWSWNDWCWGIYAFGEQE